MVTSIQIGARVIGPDRPCFVIAEAGVNHDGGLEKAVRLVEVAVEAGADAVKFQTFKAERLVTASAAKADYQVRATGSSEPQAQMLRRLELADDDHRELMRQCDRHGILFLSTPFDEGSVDLLANLGVQAFKVASGDVTNFPLLIHIASKGRPVILSTGMSSLGEVEAAVRTLEHAGTRELALLHCVSNYPAEPGDANLRAMETMARAFRVPVGYSDHTLGIEVTLAAVALGACVVEKHFTLDRTLPGPDHHMSLEPDELATLIRGIRTVDAYLRGVAVEAMAASDNVLRGGLTPKHVDVGELLRILRFEVLDDPVHAGEVEHDPARPRDGQAGHVVAGHDRRQRDAPLVGKTDEGLHFLGRPRTNDELGLAGRVVQPGRTAQS